MTETSPIDLIAAAQKASAEGQWSVAGDLWREAGSSATGADRERCEGAEQHAGFLLRAETSGGMSCNFCQSTEFKDFNGRYRVKCAKCGSLERGRFLKLYLEKLNLSPETRVLHIAPDAGLADYLQDVAGDNYYCADISSKRYGSLKNFRKVDLCQDLSEIAGQEYDLIIHSHVMEHLPCSYTCVMAKLNALLSEAGRQIVLIPIFDGYYNENLDPSVPRKHRKKYFHHNHHVRNFGREDLERTFGMMFDFAPYRSYDMRAHCSEDELVRANVANVFWQGLSLATVFDIKKTDFRI